MPQANAEELVVNKYNEKIVKKWLIVLLYNLLLYLNLIFVNFTVF